MSVSLTGSGAIEIWARLTRAINHSDRLEDIYEAALDAIQGTLAIERASILVFDADGVMRFKAWRGISEEYRRAVEGHTPWTLHQKDAEPIVVRDAAADPALAAYRSTFERERIRALAFVPVESGQGVIGKFMLYFDSPVELAPADLQLTTLIGSQIAFAVERMQAHAAAVAQEDWLRESHRAAQHLAAIVASSDDAIVSKDLNGIIQSWNQGAERMFGYTAAEAVGRSITLIIPLALRSQEDVVLRSIRSGEAVEMETVRQRKDGSPVEISLKVSPVRDRDGRIVGASKIARDVTSRKRAERERDELHRRLSLLVSASASLLGSPDSASVRTATLAVARQLVVADAYGVWRWDAAAAVWRMVTADGLSDTFARRMIAVFQGHQSPPVTPFTEPLAVPDVTAHPTIGEQSEAYRDEGIASMLVCPMKLHGTLSGTLVFYYRQPHAFSELDVQTGQALANLAAAALTTAELYDEQRVAREAAESARRHAAFLADATALLSRSLDYEHTLATVARLAVPQIADWCAVDVLDEHGRLQRLAIAHVDPAKVEYARALEERYPSNPESGIHAVIRSGRSAMMETIPPERLEAAARDDEHRRIIRELALTSYMSVPLVTSSGPRGAITFVFAESGRHYAQPDLAFAEDLAWRAALAIDNALAYRRASEANRLKDEFLATLSHELRTPLNAILGYAQMLQMGMLAPERQASAIDTLTRNARALTQIIDDVLDVSRITTGKLRLNTEAVDLQDVVRSAAATIQPAADAKGVDLRVRIARDAPTISGDADRLRQVVWNLLSNAVKFTPRGGQVTIGLAGVGSAAAEIVVADTGQGIEASFLPHIFERFRQADSRFAREHGGLGLGLAIVRELVELHGGTVTAASAGLGTGATFTVTLPAAAAKARSESDTAVAHAADAADAARGLAGRLAGSRVLVVDDQEDAIGLVRLILETAGVKVGAASSAAEALAVLRNDPGGFDAIVADIGMPGVDGLELIRRIRQTLSPPASTIPAAALTAYARSEDRIAALTSGFQIHIAKPVNPTELLVAVAALINFHTR